MSSSKYRTAGTRVSYAFIISFLFLCSFSFFLPQAGADTFESRFEVTPDRVWPGSNYWPNPMENWRVSSGQLECTSTEANRNVHLLTHPLTDRNESFELSVRVGLLETGDAGSAGFGAGIRTESRGYRADVFHGEGFNAVITTDGTLMLDGESKQLEGSPDPDNVRLTLRGTPGKNGYQLNLIAEDAQTSQELGRLNVDGVRPSKLTGNLALVHNVGGFTGSRFWFRNWYVSGDKIREKPDRAFGPILWTMYTLDNSGRKNDGHVMKMSVQMPPLGEADSDEVRLEIKRTNGWKRIDEARIDPDARNAIFRVTDWNADKRIPYRIIYETGTTRGETVRDTWTGVIRKDPASKQDELSVATLSCQHWFAYPYSPLVENVKTADPDLLFFAGDQIYEANGGYGIVREPAGKAMISYLRKFYMFGWAFRDLLRNRPTVCVPDDHDVFHGNLWGEAGEKMKAKKVTGDTAKQFDVGVEKGEEKMVKDTSTMGGYIEPVKVVNAIYRSQTAHHPGVQNLERLKNGVRTFYGDLVYGRVSFAILSDRQFKSSPREVDTGEGRADLVVDEDLDPEQLDRPDLKQLGDRQLSFLTEWAQDWRGADMKAVLSQTGFSQPMTHTGPKYDLVYADLDSNGWPQSARDRAVRTIRKSFAIHLAGDQHLPSMVQHGVEQQRDSFWTFLTPAIYPFWPRWFDADKLGIEYRNRPAHGLPNTGEYLDGFGNKMYVNAVVNPEAMEADHPYVQAHERSSGFGLVNFDLKQRTIQVNAYRFLADLPETQVGEHQFSGWPLTVRQLDNYGRERAGTLNSYRVKDVDNPVVKVYHQDTGELVYAVRAKERTVQPFVFEEGKYKVKIGDPALKQWSVYENQEIQER